MAAASSIKTNERPGTRAQVRFVRMSASKVRVVLDLVRGKHVGEASQILAFSERLASEVVMKCLASAVANASHNDDIPAEELYISACYADEGPTLKRFRPRARGRAGRIHKQTCHITVVVSRYDEETLDELRTRAEQRTAASSSRDTSADRRRRVARSRAADEVDDTADDTVADAPAAAAEDTAAVETAADTTDEAADTTEEVEDTVNEMVEDTAVEDTAVEDTAVEDTALEDPASSGDERNDDGADS
jgi:large subunit ribosomal protein L22